MPNIDTFEVVQSRGAFNQNSEFHNTIVELVNGNVLTIQKRICNLYF